MIARETVTCFASGAVAYFDPVGHTYVTDQDELYLSGSVYAHMFAYEFNKHRMLPRSAKYYGVSEETLDAYWSSKAEIAATFGTALHAALEHYGKYAALGVKDMKGLGIHPTLRPIVDAFFKGRRHEKALYEAFVADELNLRCGFIDRLVITGEKRCIIEDYKTNGDLHTMGTPATLKAPHDNMPNNNIGKYTLQLSFYHDILEAAGWTVEGRRLHWWKGKEWETIELDKADTSVMPVNTAVSDFAEMGEE